MRLCTSEQSKKFNELYLLLYKSFRDATFAHSKQFGFTVPQMMLIFELYNAPNLMLNELSERIGLSKSTTSALVARMESKGIVVREIPDDNRRTVKLSLSQEFIGGHKDLLDLKDQIISDLFKFENINFADAEKIIYALDKLNSQLRSL